MFAEYVSSVVISLQNIACSRNRRCASLLPRNVRTLCLQNSILKKREFYVGVYSRNRMNHKSKIVGIVYSSRLQIIRPISIKSKKKIAFIFIIIIYSLVFFTQTQNTARAIPREIMQRAMILEFCG